MYPIRPMTRHRQSGALRLATLCAFIASLMTLVQVGLILIQGEAFCPNYGCRMVENTTRVSPLVFNLAGLLFFQVVYWGLRASKADPHRLPQFIVPLLLAGLSVEGVLIAFQVLVTHVFCLYCLVILGFIVLINLLLGFRQALSGVLVFAATLLAYASLEQDQGATVKTAFVDGVFAARQGTMPQPEHHLFYSSTCTHCEQVIARLGQDQRPTVRFHPIDQVTSLDMPQAVLRPGYSPQVNKDLLTALGIDEVPVLITTGAHGLSVDRGAQAIEARLGLQEDQPIPLDQSGVSALPAEVPPIPGLQNQDGCQVSSDCPDPAKMSSDQSTLSR